MSGLAEGKWFVPRTSRTVPPYRKGFAPVTREGYRCFGVFTIALVGSLLAGFAVPLLMPDDPAIGIGVGIVIIIAGVDLFGAAGAIIAQGVEHGPRLFDRASLSGSHRLNV